MDETHFNVTLLPNEVTKGKKKKNNNKLICRGWIHLISLWGLNVAQGADTEF